MTNTKNTNALAALLIEMRELGKDVEADAGLDSATKSRARAALAGARHALTEARDNLTAGSGRAALAATRQVARLWPQPAAFGEMLRELEELADATAESEHSHLRKAA